MPNSPGPDAVAERVPVTFALRDLAVAPENMRFHEPPDDEIPELAETILAAGVLQPLTVRPGRRKEKPGMALDGRRRWLALQALLEAGRITDAYPVPAFVETDPARQAAAVVLTNKHMPVHPADVIVAIGKMLKAKLAPAAVAAALGFAELEVRRLAALSDLHPKAIEALRAGRLNLRQARLLARLPDRKEQGEIAEAALKGMGFQEWRITDRLDAGQVSTRDRRFRFVGPDRYAAAGGRIESDLFGERPDVLLDPEIVQSAWMARAEALSRELGVEARVSVSPPEIDDAGLEPFGTRYGMGLDSDGLAAWQAAETAEREAAQPLVGADWASEALDGAFIAYLRSKLAADLASEPPRDVSFVQVFGDSVTGLSLRAYGPPLPIGEDEPDEASLDDDETPPHAGGPFTSRPEVAAQAATPVAVAPRPELEDVGHALHEVRTDTATRALIRALADDPGAALTALVARLFSVLVLHQGRGRGGGALTLDGEAYGRRGVAPIETLDGDVRRRLADRRAAWERSELSPIAWVAGLPHGEKMALLAEVVALSLDLREERTTQVRRGARGEAVEIAVLCQADVTLHWTPDETFLAAHPKAKLLDMLDAMGAGETRAGACKKDELVSLVAEGAAERAWAPAYLSWAGEPPDEPEEDGEDAGESDAPETADRSASSEPNGDDPDADDGATAVAA